MSSGPTEMYNRPFQSFKLWLKIGLYGLLPGERFAQLQTMYMLRRREPKVIQAERQFNEVLSRIDEQSICLDLGANVGRFTELMAETGATVHAFEPDPHAFTRLQERVGRFENVVLHNAAIGPKDGTLTLTRDADFWQDPDKFTVGTGAFKSTLNKTGGESFSVEMVGLRGFLEGLGARVDLVKMDIEGVEVAVLEDLLDTDAIKRIKSIFVETHEAQMPELRQRTKALRKRCSEVNTSFVSLDWM